MIFFSINHLFIIFTTLNFKEKIVFLGGNGEFCRLEKVNILKY